MTVLARLPDRRAAAVQLPAGQRPATNVSNDVLIFTGSAKPTATKATLRLVPAAGVRGGVMPVRLVEAGGRQIAFNTAGTGPRLIPSPADPTVYVFEQAGTLRRLTAAWIVSPAVADVVRNFDRLALLAKKRPEGRYVLWAADPLWSGDGRYFTYATNREVSLAADNTVSATAYVMSDGQYQPLTPGSVHLFHRRSGTSTWSASQMTLTTESDRYAIDLDFLGYAPGTQIDWLVRALRTGLTDPHCAGFFPAQYAHPNNDPNAVGAAYPFYVSFTQ